MIGKTISHYKIIEQLGEGGMGIVYKARDIKLDRFVALKFLPHYLSSDEERKKRFVQEAKAASALDHPNIGTIYEFDETTPVAGELWSDQMFIVMAYYEGLSLKDRLQSEPLILKETIDIFTQIADGLARAHEAGITHRDIKPANIILTKRGEVKIVDFGLARNSDDTQSTENDATSGTIAYMSPEQLMGESVDNRSDIWSLGVVTYEMITGELPFRAGYEQAVIYSILKEDPVPITKHRPDVPKQLKSIITKCLEKKSVERYQAVAKLQVDVKNLKQDMKPSEKGEMANIGYENQPKRSRKFRNVWFAIAAILVTFGIYFFRPFFKVSTVPLMTEIPFTSLNGLEYAPAFSPDGEQIAFYWKENDLTDANIYVKIIATGESRQLTNHPADERYPVWLPDGQYISFVRALKDNNIYIKPALREGNEKLMYSGTTWGEHSWSPDGKWLVITESDSSNNGYLSLLSVQTGDKRSLTSTPKKIQGEVDILPVFSPHGKTIAFYRKLGFERGDIYTIAVDDSEAKQLTFDDNDVQGLTWTANGQEIIFSSNRGGDVRLWRIGTKGGTPKMLTTGLNAHYPTISPDGERLAYSEFRVEQNIWRLKVPDSPNKKVVPEKIIASSRIDDLFQISPNGERIVFESNRSGSYQIWICDNDGQNPVQITNLEDGAYGPCWSPDGLWIAFSSKPNHNYDIFVVSINGGKPKRVTTRASHDIFPQWSKDGNWIYFSSNRLGTHQIWKIPLKGGSAIQMTRDGARRGFESANGKWFYYCQSNNDTIWKIPVTGGEKLLVLDEEIGAHDWSLMEDGIYYIDFRSKIVNIKFLDFATQTTKTITTLELEGECRYPQISPDRLHIFFLYEEPWQADIKLVENWR
jgi:eukaryotic-like serine/threonine-protein kinase